MSIEQQSIIEQQAAENAQLQLALKRLLDSDPGIGQASDDDLRSAINDPDADELVREQAAAVLHARDAIRLQGAGQPKHLPVRPEQDNGFRGDNEKLIGCINALLELDEAKALVPHGIGGHARTLLTAAASRLVALPSAAPIEEREADEPLACLHIGGIDGDEFEDNDITVNTKAVEALQERLVTYVKNYRGCTVDLYARAALSAPAIPEGHAIVPIEITEEMHVAAVRTIIKCNGNDDFPPRVWKAMVAAAQIPADQEEAK